MSVEQRLRTDLHAAGQSIHPDPWAALGEVETMAARQQHRTSITLTLAAAVLIAAGVIWGPGMVDWITGQPDLAPVDQVEVDDTGPPADGMFAGFPYGSYKGVSPFTTDRVTFGADGTCTLYAPDPGGQLDTVVVDGETLGFQRGTFSVDETTLTVTHRICAWGTDSEPGTEQATYTWEWDGNRLTMTSEDDNCTPRERLFAELLPIDPLPTPPEPWAETLGVVDLDQPVEWSRNGLALSVDRLFIADADTFRTVVEASEQSGESFPMAQPGYLDFGTGPVTLNDDLAVYRRAETVIGLRYTMTNDTGQPASWGPGAGMTVLQFAGQPGVVGPRAEVLFHAGHRVDELDDFTGTFQGWALYQTDSSTVDQLRAIGELEWRARPASGPDVDYPDGTDDEYPDDWPRLTLTYPY
jgi:hypothetical protein